VSSETEVAAPVPADVVAGDDADAGLQRDELDQLGLDDPRILQSAVEAVLFVSDVPLATVDIAAALRRPEPEVDRALHDLGADLDDRQAGTELREVAGGYRLYTRSDLAPAVERFLRDGQRTRLTQASLETLAVIAYRQPVTRGRVAAIRGVNVDGVVRTLLSRGLVTEVGTDPDTGAGLYATTDLFLEKIGVGGLDELPSLGPLLPDLDDLDATDGLDLDAY
jgi:segregation and condensation protein B